LYDGCLAKKDIFWINLWQRSGGAPRMELKHSDAIEEWVNECVKKYYGPDTDDGTLPVLDGYGFITNPIGSRTQPWHVDYALSYSTIFVPLTRLTPDNATQYAVLPHDTPIEVMETALKDLDKVDMSVFAEKGSGYSVRQCIAKPFSLLRMDYGTIHRGVANNAKENRVMFWISVKKTSALLPPEDVVEVIEKGLDTTSTAAVAPATEPVAVDAQTKKDN